MDKTALYQAIVNADKAVSRAPREITAAYNLVDRVRGHVPASIRPSIMPLFNALGDSSTRIHDAVARFREGSEQALELADQQQAK